MSELFFADGRLSWVFFGLLVFTLGSLLVTDWVWRLVTMRAWILLPLALALWMTGIVGILVIGLV